MAFSFSGLTARSAWFRAFAYILFACSTFTITGVEFAVIFLYLLAIFTRTLKIPSSPLPLWVLAPFAAWIGIAILSSLVNPGWLSNLISLRHQYRIFLPFVLLIALENVNLERLLKVYLVFASVIAFYGLGQSYFAIDLLRGDTGTPFRPVFVGPEGQTVYRARGLFAGPGLLANQMMMIAVLFFSLAIGIKGGIRILWAFGASMALVGLASSFGRSSWLALLIGLLVLLLRLPRRWAIPSIVAAGGILLASVIFVGSGSLDKFISGSSRSAITHRIATTTTENSEIKVRLILWKTGLKTVKEKPWLGHGFENRQSAVANLPDMPPEIRWRFPLNKAGMDFHNIYIQIAHDFGLIGLAAYLSIWITIFVWNGLWIMRAGSGFEFEAALLWGTSAALVASMVDGFFHDTFFSGNVNASILIYMGLSLFAGLRIQRNQRQKPA